MKIENETLSTSVYPNDDRTEARVAFWPSEEGVETAYLHFKTKEEDGSHCEPEPFKISYIKSVLNTGTKMNIEIASNGFIMKVGSDIKIAQTEYDLKNMMGDIINTVTEHEIDYDESEHSFSNLGESISNVIAELA